MKLKSLFVTVCLTLVALTVNAQGMEFMPEGSLFKDAVAKATKENKMIFLDCYTSWCGPCKAMAANVFPAKEVGDYMNPRFVSIKIDMEKGEGPELNRKFQVSAYPTMIIFNSRGDEIGRIVGGGGAAQFIERVKEKSVDTGMADLDKRFDNGERNLDFLLSYVQTLGVTYKRDRANDVAEAILEGKTETFASDSVLASVFMKYIVNPFCPAFIAVAKNPAPLMATIGRPQIVQAKISQVFMTYPRSIIIEKDGTATMDEALFSRYLDLLKECGMEGMYNNQRLSTYMTLAEKQQNWKSYVNYLTEFLADPNLDMSDLDLCKKATPIMKECKDQNLRTATKMLIDQRLSDLNTGKREPQTRAGNMIISGPVDRILNMLSEGLSKPWTENPQQQ
ncbi:MAG: thioredoxin family protein [Bacteroidaceae bacterium]|nr:thioredoxin family protein [Bacteroidaceae bacterium]